MDNKPRLHPREIIVNKARADLSAKIVDWLQLHENLTEAEMVSILAGAFADQIQGFMKYQIRFERHGRTDRPGGLK